MKTDGKIKFVKLEETVTLASSSPAMVKTSQAGRVLGFGCDEPTRIAETGLATARDTTARK